MQQKVSIYLANVIASQRLESSIPFPTNDSVKISRKSPFQSVMGVLLSKMFKMN